MSDQWAEVYTAQTAAIEDLRQRLEQANARADAVEAASTHYFNRSFAANARADALQTRLDRVWHELQMIRNDYLDGGFYNLPPKIEELVSSIELAIQEQTK